MTAGRADTGIRDGESRDEDFVPLAVVMITYNEVHHLESVLHDLSGWAREVFIVDSYSTDGSVEVAIRHGAHVVQRPFRDFGEQWRFAVQELPISAPWTMKLDPDERLTTALKQSIERAIAVDGADGFRVSRRLWFMGRPLPVRTRLLRIWRTGKARFSAVSVNEYPLVDGLVLDLEGDLEHHDSPNLHHWIRKQNRYTSLEAQARYTRAGFSADPKLFGTALQRRMWAKKHFFRLPFRYGLLFMLNVLRARPWKTGRVAFAWARWRVWVMRTIEDKWREMEQKGEVLEVPPHLRGRPHPDAVQMDADD